MIEILVSRVCSIFLARVMTVAADDRQKGRKDIQALEKSGDEHQSKNRSCNKQGHRKDSAAVHVE